MLIKSGDDATVWMQRRARQTREGLERASEAARDVIVDNIVPGELGPLTNQGRTY